MPHGYPTSPTCVWCPRACNPWSLERWLPCCRFEGGQKPSFQGDAVSHIQLLDNPGESDDQPRANIKGKIDLSTCFLYLISAEECHSLGMQHMAATQTYNKHSKTSKQHEIDSSSLADPGEGCPCWDCIAARPPRGNHQHTGMVWGTYESHGKHPRADVIRGEGCIREQAWKDVVGGSPGRHKTKVCLVPSSIAKCAELILVSCRMAAQYAQKHFNVMAQNNWLEMGVLSITIFARTTPDGQLAVEMYVLRTHGYAFLTTCIGIIKLQTH